MSEKIKLDDKIVKEHISDWSYEIKDDLGNKVVKQKGDRAYTPFNVTTCDCGIKISTIVAIWEWPVYYSEKAKKK